MMLLVLVNKIMVQRKNSCTFDAVWNLLTNLLTNIIFFYIIIIQLIGRNFLITSLTKELLLSTFYEYINNLRLLSTTNSGDNACKVKIKNQRYLNILIEFSQSRLEHKIQFFFSWNMKKRRIITGVKQ